MSELVAEVSGRVLYLTLNRPRCRNALSRNLLNALQTEFSTAAGEQYSAVVIRGCDGVFSAGADLTELTGSAEDTEMDFAISGVTEHITDCPMPVVAMIDGPCMGGAVDIALACDLRVATGDAFLEVPATRLGLLYDPQSVKRLAGRYPHGVMTRLFVVGERFEAPAAVAAGLVTHVGGSPADTRTLLDSLLRRLDANDPLAMRHTKALLDALASGQFDAEHWQAARLECLESPGRRAALAAARGEQDAGGGVSDNPGRQS